MPMTPEQRQIVANLKAENDKIKDNQKKNRLDDYHEERKEESTLSHKDKLLNRKRLINEKWEEFSKELHSVREHMNRGYSSEWTSIFYTTITLTRKIGEMLASHEPLSQVYEKIDLLLGSSLTGIGLWIKGIPDPAYDYLFNDPPEGIFDDVNSYVTMNEQGTLKFSFDRLGNIAPEQKAPLEIPLKGAVGAWLENHHPQYTLNMDNNTITDEDGVQIDEFAFNELRDNLDTGLKPTLVHELGALVTRPLLRP